MNVLDYPLTYEKILRLFRIAVIKLRIRVALEKAKRS